MNLRKRIFLVVAFAALLFTAITVGPIYKRSISTVHAQTRPHAPDVVTFVCSEPGASPDPEPGVISVDSSNPAVALPTIGSGCAAALQGFYAQGFVRQDYSGEAIQWHMSGGLGTACYYLTACSVEKIFQWVLVRGTGPWNAQ